MRYHANDPNYPNRTCTEFREMLPMDAKSRNDGPKVGQFKLISDKIEAFEAEHELLMDLGRLVDVYQSLDE